MTRFEITDAPDPADEAFVVEQTRVFNGSIVGRDLRPLCVFARDETGRIVGGLTARTYWAYLDISFLWVDASVRGAGHGAALMAAAEGEARARGCRHVLLDTFSFQAPGFYAKLGYVEFGRLRDFTDGHERHYLTKDL
jgi:GNAT superfamily N-acetyltransferase